MNKLLQFVPMTGEEMAARRWEAIDILIITGDAYIDHPSFGPVVIARTLLDAGYRVGLIAQPDWHDPESLKLFGRPLLGCGVSSGNMDSMVKLYTVGRRLRQIDQYSPGGRTGLCPPHASVVYSQLAKQAFPGLPVILGGMEVSLRRLAHYDYWQDKIRPSMLVDAKADLLCYGLGELTMLEIFQRLKEQKSLEEIRGTCRYLTGKESAAFIPGENDLELPSYEEVCADPRALMRQTVIVEQEMNPGCGRRLRQQCRGRLLLAEPPREAMTTEEFDHFSELPYTGLPHWSYQEKIPAWEVIKDSLTIVRGCPGGCAFCGLVSHQSRQLVCRSPESVLRSVDKLAGQPFFRGTISDVGGAAGNIYGHRPKNPARCAKCRRVSCLFPEFCPNYDIREKPLMELLDRIKKHPKVKHLYINSGIRLDLALKQPAQTAKIIRDHVSGQLSVAPEHLNGRTLALMRKGKAGEFEEFRKIFERESSRCGKKQFLIPYFISNFPGCTAAEMKEVENYLRENHWNPQQVQDFIPLAMTMGTAMYCCGETPNGEPLTVNRGLARRREQRDMLTPGAKNHQLRSSGKDFRNCGKKSISTKYEPK